MKEAVEDHRASSSRQPRSIYGKIVAEADRDIDVHEIFLRAIQYGKEIIQMMTRSSNGSGSASTWTKIFKKRIHQVMDSQLP